MHKPFTILALDAGSTGTVTLGLLQRIQSALPAFLESVDIFAGTSAGSMTAGILASTADPARALSIAQSYWAELDGHAVWSPRALLGLTGLFPIMPNHFWLQALERALGDATLETLPRKLIIPALSVSILDAGRHQHGGVRVFSNLMPQALEAKERLRDIIARSASAPIVSPVYQGYVDGGLFAPNPSMLAITWAMDQLDAEFEDFLVLSVGSGLKNWGIRVGKGRLGFWHWLFNPKAPLSLLRAISSSSSQAINYQCSRIVRDRYWRLEPMLGRRLAAGRGGPSHFQEALQATDIEPTLRWLRTHGWCRGV